MQAVRDEVGSWFALTTDKALVAMAYSIHQWLQGGCPNEVAYALDLMLAEGASFDLLVGSLVFTNQMRVEWNDALRESRSRVCDMILAMEPERAAKILVRQGNDSPTPLDVRRLRVMISS